MGYDGLHDMQALRKLYFEQKKEHALKPPMERKKDSYLDLAHTLDRPQPGDASKKMYNLAMDRKLKDSYTPKRDTGIKSVYTNNIGGLYTLLRKPETNLYRHRDEDEVDMYIS